MVGLPKRPPVILSCCPAGSMYVHPCVRPACRTCLLPAASPFARPSGFPAVCLAVPSPDCPLIPLAGSLDGGKGGCPYIHTAVRTSGRQAGRCPAHPSTLPAAEVGGNTVGRLSAPLDIRTPGRATQRLLRSETARRYRAISEEGTVEKSLATAAESNSESVRPSIQDIACSKAT